MSAGTTHHTEQKRSESQPHEREEAPESAPEPLSVAPPKKKLEDPRVDVRKEGFEERRERIRAESLRDLPRWYNPWMHLAGTTGVGLVTLIVAATRIHGVRWTDLLVVPITWLIANGFEWRVHKDVLHRRTWPLEIIYDRHTPMHHMVYTEDDLSIRSSREFGLVLIPAMGVLGIVVAAAPFAALLGHFLGANVGWLMLVAAGLYMVTYELSHLSYHQPPESFIGRIGLVRVLRAHHARHHDPTLMKKWNFNVTLPLFDWIHGTIHSPERESEKAAKKAAK